MVPGDRLVCAFCEPVEVGQEFGEWLLHVTLVPWFRLDKDSAEIAAGLTSVMQGIEPFEYEVAKEAQFGHNRGKPANLVAVPSPFGDIERLTREYFHQQNAWLVDETTSRRRDYSPHITAQRSKRVHEGDRLTCDRLYIVRQLGGSKLVEMPIVLGAAQ